MTKDQISQYAQASQGLPTIGPGGIETMASAAGSHEYHQKRQRDARTAAAAAASAPTAAAPPPAATAVPVYRDFRQEVLSHWRGMETFTSRNFAAQAAGIVGLSNKPPTSAETDRLKVLIAKGPSSGLLPQFQITESTAAMDKALAGTLLGPGQKAELRGIQKAIAPMEAFMHENRHAIQRWKLAWLEDQHRQRLRRKLRLWGGIGAVVALIGFLLLG
ncbi:hypothetical protein [Roseisalinus antarcticus]|uniref:Uncharacterized protein n=1 Tax=Roseisalinus antarcticus TaxID=254357 RepID=A0A1Y5S0F0_9RHOB|nr:hypothetical protein [Roseisalinus antarcticus]SLN28361.1 hypothetical protein ROA7023_00956 [Roseisalinus antarcticus]